MSYIYEKSSIWNYEKETHDEFWISEFLVKSGDRSIEIPIIRPDIKKVESITIRTNADIHKCLGFMIKINFLNCLIERNLYANYILWDQKVVADSHKLDCLLKRFNYYTIYT